MGEGRETEGGRKREGRGREKEEGGEGGTEGDGGGTKEVREIERKRRVGGGRG